MSNFIDLKGQIFGRLKVIERGPDYISPSGEKRVQWKCQCDCGNICYVLAKQLRNGKAQSCGCLRKEKTIERNKNTANNLTGQKFGKLTALYPTDKRSKQKYIIWHCKCDCGNECDVISNNLIKGQTKSCGCLIKEKNAEKIKDLTNQRFGKLVALSPTDRRSGTSVIWKCQCDCGNICYVASNSLSRGDVQSCGCLNKFIGEEKISKILKDNQIIFERQKTFDSCRFLDTNALAKFDFYLPNYNILIEYDGIQHFQPRKFGGCSQKQAEENFQKTQEHDKFKNQWCKENNIKLIRISYIDINKIKLDDLLLQEE